MKIKAISIDLDGTLIKEGKYSSSEINTECINQIKRFTSAGGKIVISTGRDVGETIEVFKHLTKNGIEPSSIPYLISLNGSAIVDTADNFKLISKKIFDSDLSKKLISFITEKRYSFFIINSNSEYYANSTLLSYIVWFFLYRLRGYKFNKYTSDVPLTNVQKIMVTVFFKKVSKAKEIFTEKFGNYCYCSCGRGFIEFIDVRVNKFFALQEVANLLCISIDEFAAIGNEQNDVLSLENVGFGAGVDLDKKHLYIDMSKIDYTVSNDDGTAVAEVIKEMNSKGFFSY